MELENHSKGRRREKEEMMDKRSYTFLNFGLASATLGGHPCQTEHLQRLVERRAAKEDRKVVTVETAFEGGSLHRD